MIGKDRGFVFIYFFIVGLLCLKWVKNVVIDVYYFVVIVIKVFGISDKDVFYKKNYFNIYGILIFIFGDMY